MKTSAAALCLLGFALPALAQELAPSPTQSIGCVPHGDHWHCEGPRPAPTLEVTTTTEPVPAVTTTTTAVLVEEETTDAAGNSVLAPSPTQSVGCEPHGDHWHCESSRPAETGGESTPAPAETLTTVVTTASSSGSASGIIEASSTASTSGAEPPVVTAGAARAIGAHLLGLAALVALGL